MRPLFETRAAKGVAIMGGSRHGDKLPRSSARRLPLVLASLSLVGLVTATTPSAHATPTTVVVPNANATVEGNLNNADPFDCGSGSMRYQQVYTGSQVGSGSISQLAFRDGTFAATV